MDMVFEYLSMTRVYTKPKGQMPDYEAPVIIRGSQKPTVEVFCKKIHRQLIHDFKYGWVWGSSVKFNPQKVGKAHLLQHIYATATAFAALKAMIAGSQMVFATLHTPFVMSQRLFATLCV